MRCSVLSHTITKQHCYNIYPLVSLTDQTDHDKYLFMKVTLPQILSCQSALTFLLYLRSSPKNEHEHGRSEAKALPSTTTTST